MIVALWCGRNRRWTAVAVQALRRRPAGVFRDRLVVRDLFRHAALGGLALRQRRHRRTGRAGRDRRLALLVAAAEADIGKPLQERQAGLLRMFLFGRLAAGL